jgi:hypothetical protein
MMLIASNCGKEYKKEQEKRFTRLIDGPLNVIKILFCFVCFS